MMKNKILFLLHIPPPVHGSSVVGLFIKSSTKINNEFKCLYVNLLASKDVADSGTVNFNKILGFFVTFYKVFVSLLKKPQVCYMALTTTGAAFYKDLILVAIIKVFRIKLIYHLHNKGVSRYHQKKFNKLCYGFVFKNTDVILLSQRLYHDIQTFVPESKIHICPNGIPDFFPKTTYSKLAIDAQNPPNHQIGQNEKQVQVQLNPAKILFLSNLNESKGVFLLVDACALLKRKNIQFECVFIGGEGDITGTRFNEYINQLGLSEEVSYHGKKYGQEKIQAFSQSDIFVFPTFEDCFPLVLLEAMSFALPIISTFEGGIPNIVEDKITGFLIPKNDIFVLAEKMELLINNPNIRHEMGIAGREKYEKKFTIEIFERRMTELLTQFVEK